MLITTTGFGKLASNGVKSIRIKVIAAFGLALALLVFTGGVAYWATAKFITDSRQVAHTQEVIGQLEGVLSTINDADAATRGYLLTGAEAYLQPYQKVREEIVPQFQRLRDLIKDDPDQRRRFIALVHLTAGKLASIRRLITTRRDQGFEAARRQMDKGPGNPQMEQIRRLIAEMESAETQVLHDRSLESQSGAHRAKRNIVVMICVTSLLLSLACYFIDRDLTGRKRAEAALRHAYDDLEIRVRDRTSALARTNQSLLEEIAERTAADKSLRESEERKGAILHSALDCIFTIDHEGKITEWNPAAEKTFGRSRTDALGKEMAELMIPKPMRETHRQGMARCLATGVGSMLGKRIELTAMRADATEFPAEISITRIGSDTPPKFTGFLRDISERKRAEEALRQSQEELESRVAERTTSLQREVIVRRRAEAELETLAARLKASNRELQDFASVASHDLQEPLRKIISYGDLLKEQAASLTDADRDYLARMQNAAKRMQTLIDDLLAFSRITSRAQSFEPVNLNAVAQGVLSDLETRIQQTGGKVELGELPTIDADPTQMRQLLQNLIGNALKFHREGQPPVVKVRSERVTETTPPLADTDPVVDRCRIAVEDNGIGFDEKYLDRIFTVFQRLHGRGKYEGTGMGLAICRKIVERHGGEIIARSAPERGATFVVTLPIKRSQAPKNG